MFDAAGDLRLGRIAELEFIEDVAGHARFLFGSNNPLIGLPRCVARRGEPLIAALHADRGGQFREPQIERHQLDLGAALQVLVGEGLPDAVGRRIGGIGKADLVMLVVGVAPPIPDRIDARR